MKPSIITFLAVLLISGCDKPSEKQGGVSAVPKQEERLKPSGATPPAPTAAKPSVPMPSPEELAAFAAEVQAFEKKAGPLLKDPNTKSGSPEANSLQATCDELLQKRAKLSSGMTMEQRKAMIKTVMSLMRLRSELLDLKNGRPETPPQQDALLNELAPAPAGGAPPQNSPPQPNEQGAPATPEGSTPVPP